MQDLIAEGLDLGWGQSVRAGDVLVARRILGDEGALADDIAIGLEALGAAEVIDIGE